MPVTVMVQDVGCSPTGCRHSSQPFWPQASGEVSSSRATGYLTPSTTTLAVSRPFTTSRLLFGRHAVSATRQTPSPLPLEPLLLEEQVISSKWCMNSVSDQKF